MEQRFYYDPGDDFATDILLPLLVDEADRTQQDIEEIPMNHHPPAGSARAKEDGVEQLPTLVFRDDGVVEMYGGYDAIIACLDDEPLDTLAIEKGYLSEDGREWDLDT
jgi:hypothetical protein